MPMVSTFDPEAHAPRHTLVRRRLLRKLEHASTQRLTVIHAPAGCGKRTLAQHDLAARRAPVCWLNMERAHRDFPVFHTAVLAALRERVPAVEALSARAGDGPEEAAAALAWALKAALRRPLTLVLEDAHMLAGAAPVEAWLRAFALQLPGQLRLMLLCEALPALPLAELSARRALLMIGQQELRFTHDEVLALASARDLEHRLPPTGVLRRLQGWPSGVTLALQALPPGAFAALPQQADNPQALYEPLALALLETLPADLRQFLLHASTLPRFAPSQLQQALGLRGSALLREALQRGLLEPRAARELCFARPLREVLQRELQRSQPAGFQRLHEQAAAWRRRHDAPDSAFAHLLTAGQVQAAAELAESAAADSYRAGQHELLLRWDEALAEAHPAGPKLRFFCAAALADRGESAAALTALDQAAAGDRAASTEALLLRARILLGQGSPHMAAALCQRVLNAPGAASAHGRALSLLSAAREAQGEGTAALQLLREAARRARDQRDATALAGLLDRLQALLLARGQIDEAAACLRELIGIWRTRRQPGSALARVLCAYGRCCHLQGEYAHALEAMTEALRMASQGSGRQVECAALRGLADIQRDLGDCHEAYRLVVRALELAPEHDPALRCGILLSASVLHRWMGRPEHAAVLAHEALALAQAHELPAETWQAQALHWAAIGMRGQREAAAEHVLQAADELEGLQAYSEAAQAHMLCAGLALAGAPTHVEASVHNAAQALRGGGSPQQAAAEAARLPAFGTLLAGMGAPAAGLLNALAALRRAQIARPQAPRLAAKPVPAFTHRLRLHLLGAERIECDGMVVPPELWRAVVARELLYYLAMSDGRLREDICQEIWPGKTLERMRFIFHTSIHRLRHTVGENIVVFEGELYRINADVDVWCDVHALSALMARARALPVQDPQAEALFRRAIALYQGEFLPNFSAEWASDVRDRLHRLHRESLIGLARCAYERRAYHEAERAFQQVLTLEPLREEVHRGVLRCYAGLGDRQRLQEHYAYMTELFREELGAELAPRTVTLMEALLQ